MASVAASNHLKTKVISVLANQELQSGSAMARWEQFEIWQKNGEKWELLGAFSDLQVANTMARSRSTHTRLIRAVYEGENKIEQDVIADIGPTRDVA